MENNLITNEQKSPHVIVEMLRGGLEIIDGLEDDWRKICEEGPNEQPFQRPEWSRAYMRHFAAECEVVVFTARETGGRLIALLPLYREKKWVIPGLFAVWKLHGTSMVDGYPFDLIVASNEEAEYAVKALWDAIDKFPGWHILELPNVAEGGASEILTQSATRAGATVFPWTYMRTPHISLGDWDGENPFRLARSKNLRHTLKRILNTKATNGMVLRRVKSAAEGFEQFFTLENRSWKGKAERTVAGSEKLRKFYMEIAEAAERFGYLSFYFLDIGGEAVASRFALTYRGHYGELECVHDEKYNDHAPGHLVIGEILSDCAKRGFKEVDLSGHTYEYKEKWTTNFKPHTYWFIYRRGMVGWLLYWLKTRVRPMANRIISLITKC